MGSRRRRFLLPLIVALSIASAAEPSWAGGYFLLPRGAVALGRGGALSAGARDLSAAWLNPGRLAALEGVQVLGDIGFTWWSLDFQRAADPEIAPHGFANAENIAPMVTSPSLFLGWDCNLDWLQVTLGFYGPYAGDLGFDSMGPQRYTLVYLDMFYAVYELAAAVRPVRWLAIGAAFQIHDVRMTEAVKMTAYTGFDALGPPENPSDDVMVEVDVASHFNPSGLFGIWIAPADWVDLGVAVQLPISVEAAGTSRVTLPTDNALLRNAHVEGDEITVHLAAATVLRAGVSFRLPYRFELEVDVWAEFWQPHEDIVMQAHDIYFRNVEGGMDIEVLDVTLPQDWQASYGVAGATEWEAIEDRLRLRIGVYYDSGAIPDQTVSVAWFDSHKVGFGIGLSVEVWHLSIDVAYGHTFFVPRTIDNSEIVQVNPIEPQDPELADVVGNGSYQSALDVVGISISAEIPTRSRRGSSGEEDARDESENVEDEGDDEGELPAESHRDDPLADEEVSPDTDDEGFDPSGFDEF